DKESSEDKLKKKITETESKTAPKKVTTISKEGTPSKESTPSKEATLTLPAAPVGGVVSQPVIPLSSSVDEPADKVIKKDLEKDSDKENCLSPHQAGGTTIPPINLVQNVGGNQSIPAINSSVHYIPVSVNNFNLSSPNLLGSLWGPTPVRINDKAVKKSSSSNFKKPSPSNHHSVSISPQPLQTEKSSLHDKLTHYDSTKTSKKNGEKGLLSFPEVRGLSLPEVKGAEAKTKDKPSKKSNVTVIPHITNLDFMGSTNQHNSLDSDKDNSLPNV
ncbi:hypothetical protein LOTGIDRAFT_155568, partial [Lottia gigantea]